MSAFKLLEQNSYIILYIGSNMTFKTQWTTFYVMIIMEYNNNITLGKKILFLIENVNYPCFVIDAINRYTMQSIDKYCT